MPISDYMHIYFYIQNSKDLLFFYWGDFVMGKGDMKWNTT